MDDMKKHDLKINGATTWPGGNYNNVAINGAGTINGDLECIDIKVNGACDVHGKVKTRTGRVNGTATFGGDFESDAFSVHGSFNSQGSVTTREISIAGSTSISGSLTAEKVQIRGEVRIEGDCNAEDFVSKGGFRIDGLLNAGNIDITIYVGCQVKEIGGEKISVKKGLGFALNHFLRSIFLPARFDGLKTESIEGDDIYLENTKAQVVRGNNVTIGHGCEIDLVEYKYKFEQQEESKVGESKKV
ncbi:MAG: polymer-forming cytoskeletal protein [Bacillota bacterium]